MDCSTPGFPVHHQLPEVAQTHVHRAGDATQPSHSLSSPSLPAFNLCQHQGLWQSQLFASGDQSIGPSASSLFLPVNIQSWFPLGWTGWISLQSKWLSRVFASTTVWRYQFFSTQTFYIGQLSHLYMTTRKTIALTIWTFVGKVMSLHYNILSRLVMAFLQGASVLISCQKSPFTVILEPKKIKSVTVSIVFPFKFSRLI